MPCHRSLPLESPIRNPELYATVLTPSGTSRFIERAIAIPGSVISGDDASKPGYASLSRVLRWIRVGAAPSPIRFSMLDVGQPIVFVAIVAPRQLSGIVSRCESVALCQRVSAAVTCTHGLGKRVRTALGVLAEGVFRVSAFFSPGRRCKTTVDDGPCGVV